MPIITKLDLAYGPHSRHRLNVYSPAPRSRAPIVIFWHGGSWSGGDKRYYGFVGRAIAKMGYVAVVANYRLYPEVRFPEFIHDAALAVKWVSDSLELGDSEKIFLIGHSAGAHIAALVAFNSHYLREALVDPRRIAGFIGMSGPYDFYPRVGLRPIFNLPSDDQSWLPTTTVDSTPPALLVHGRFDNTVKPENAQTFASILRTKGADVELQIYNNEHMLIILGLLPGFHWLNPGFRDIKAFLDAHS